MKLKEIENRNLEKFFSMNFLLAFFISQFFCSSILLGATLQEPIRTIKIKAIPGLKYDQVEFQVKPGERIKLELINEDDMSHNLIITKPGKRLEIVNQAMALAEKGPGMNYIPVSSSVLWTIPVISPGQRKSITFTAPKTPGTYPYVCTYPGHGFIMFGNMKVIANAVKAVAKVEKPKEEQKADSLVQPHPYKNIPPYVYRAFVEGASPAALSVHLPKKLSYCWDIGTCRLRFAWQGDFIDNTDLWKGHFDASAKILGNVFYRDYTQYPITIGEDNDIPQVKYKGYRLIDRYPEFHYTIDGIDVYELILPKDDGSGLIRKFRIKHSNEAVYFHINLDDESMHYESTVGEWEGKTLKILPHQSHEFTITMTSYHLLFKRKSK